MSQGPSPTPDHGMAYTAFNTTLYVRGRNSLGTIEHTAFDYRNGEQLNIWRFQNGVYRLPQLQYCFQDSDQGHSPVDKTKGLRVATDTAMYFQS
ncbi:MAG: hypothetical protein J3R72DRAFT_493579 [Linnemannia gamsii]|nr:MAG: hypothetical protein J3R72DRAFT_493579 [Linnemannia gamsii]